MGFGTTMANHKLNRQKKTVPRFDTLSVGAADGWMLAGDWLSVRGVRGTARHVDNAAGSS